MEKPFSPACERNQAPILEVLQQYIQSGEDIRLLEIGSGTGQHGVYFASNLPEIHWITSDMKRNHAGIKSWLQEAKLKNLHGPEPLEIGKDDFPGKRPFNAVFSANTLHIMSWKLAKTLFKLLGKRLREGSLVFFYGPFNYAGEYSSESNREFDGWLKDRDEKSGIRNFEDVVSAMEKNDFALLKDHEMPANNRMIVFRKKARL